MDKTQPSGADTTLQKYKHEWYMRNRLRLSIRAKEYREQNKERIAKRTKAYRSRPEVKAANTARHRKYREKNAWKHLARTTLGYALRSGKITKQPCARCGAIEVQAHHTDYTKPLEVTWLCRLCHWKEHVQIPA